MAIGTVCEFETRVARLVVGPRCVTTLAQHVAVFACKRKLCLRVIELLSIDRRALPSVARVAPRAIGAKAALVLIFVAIRAAGCQSKPSSIQILACKYRASLRRNVLRSMTGFASHTDVLSIQTVSGLRVIESTRRRIPMHHLKISAVVIGVTFDASRSGHLRPWKRRMQSAILLKFSGDFLVAFQAAELGRSRRHGMALRTIGSSIKALMSPRQRAWRNLSCAESGEERCECTKESKTSSTKRDVQGDDSQEYARIL